MSLPKGIGSRQKSVTGNNQVRQQTTPCDDRCFNLKDSHSKSNDFSSPVIPLPPPLNTIYLDYNMRHTVSKFVPTRVPFTDVVVAQRL